MYMVLCSRIYRDKSILLPYTPVETRSVKLWRNISKFIRFFLYNEWHQQLNMVSLKIDYARWFSAQLKFKLSHKLFIWFAPQN